MKKIFFTTLILIYSTCFYGRTPIASYKLSSAINGRTYNLTSDYYIVITRFDFGTGIQYIGNDGWVCINRTYFHGTFDYIKTYEHPKGKDDIKFNYVVDYDITLTPSLHEEWYKWSPWGFEIFGPCEELKFACAPNCFVELNVYKREN